jgi:hypothetical protein
MALAAGTRLGAYEVLAQIGAGGMGEVYRARDTRLDRIVAIKVLPTHLADRSELRERFEREARTIASLNHPHICTLFDIGQQDGIDYLVMEYLEVTTQSTFSSGKPKALFEGQYLAVQTGQMGTAYDVSSDGQRFLMIKPVEQAQAAPTQINVVLNWFEELKGRVPPGTK